MDRGTSEYLPIDRRQSRIVPDRLAIFDPQIVARISGSALYLQRLDTRLVRLERRYHIGSTGRYRLILTRTEPPEHLFVRCCEMAEISRRHCRKVIAKF